MSRQKRLRQLQRARNRSETVDRWFAAIMVFVACAVVAFWTVVGIVAYHFISRAW